MLRLIAVLLAGVAGKALANDSTASTAAGGLELRTTADIDMLREDLLVSPGRIDVRYVFRNRTNRDVHTIVAFPMPVRDLAEEHEGDVAFPSNFHTTVEGRRVATRLERKAIAGGRDHRALLERLGIPVAPQSIEAASAAMNRLPASPRAELQRLGLAAEQQWDEGQGIKSHLVPRWTVHDTYYWQQSFPAGRPIQITHGYTPGAGGSVETPLASKAFRRTAEGRAMIARYCVDRQFLAALDRAASLRGAMGSGLPDRRIDYVLTTGANWARPIQAFRLTVDKGRPGNLVSFCGQQVRKISPTRFEVRRANWRPTKDLHVLIVEPRR